MKGIKNLVSKLTIKTKTDEATWHHEGTTASTIETGLKAHQVVLLGGDMGQQGLTVSIQQTHYRRERGGLSANMQQHLQQQAPTPAERLALQKSGRNKKINALKK